VLSVAENIYNYKVKAHDSHEVLLEQYRGNVLLIVNVASKCGFTPQYKGLEDLYLKYKDQGLVVLGFPCNQFGAQEPGSEAEIQQFCQLNYGVTFPVYAKVNVNGDKTEPLYQWLKKSAPGLFGTEMIKWNFTKFLVNKDGLVVKRFAPTEEPQNIEIEIRKLLGL
jgi:glutathione peroxidase